MFQVAKKNGISKSTYFSGLRHGWSEERAATEPLNVYTGDYAVYRKGELIAMGSREECATELGVTAEYIHWLTTPTGIKRREQRKNPEMAMTAIKLDDEKEGDFE